MPLPSRPIIFMKPITCLCHPNENILIPQVCQNNNNNDKYGKEKGEIDWEVELVIIIGKECKNVLKENALNYILGYTVGNDVSARKWQLEKELSGGQWIRGKSFDTFCPLGPALLLQENNVNANNLKLWCTVNGKKMQDSNTNDLIFNIQEIVSFVSQGTTLLPGTVILTGTPSGIGWGMNPKQFLKDGDQVIVGIEHIGELVNDVKNESISKL